MDTTQINGSDSLPLHPMLREALSWFDFDHLAPHLQLVSAPFCDVANQMIAHLFDASRDDWPSTQLLLGLQDLLRAKDCFVRAATHEFARQQYATAVATSVDLQEARKQAIVEFAARLERITPENPMGVELPGTEDSFPTPPWED